MRTQRNGELYKDDINKRLEPLFAAEKAEYDKYTAYLKGDNYSIMNAEAKEMPDNRVPGAFAYKICGQHKGYSAKAGYITYKSTGGGQYAGELKKQVFDNNDEQLLTSELYFGAIGYGKVYELYKTVKYGSKMKIRMYKIPIGSGVMVYDDTLDKNPVAFVTISIIEENISGAVNKITELVIYYAGKVVTYQRGNKETEFRETARKPHPFGAVPAVEYVPNEFKIPIYYPVLAMIDEHDKITSSSYADERERYANSYLLMLRRLNAALDDKGMSEADKMKLVRIFDGLGEITNADGTAVKSVKDAIGFLTKPSRGDDTKEAADRFERLIYDLSMTVNTNDQTFNAVTGIALKLKLLPMEWLATDIETYFSRGLQKRLDLIGNAMQTLYNMTPEEITINFRRNIPVDINSLADTAGKLKGILSDPTILTLFPADVIPDIKKELELLEKQIQDLPAA